ncbi:unnamed protein product [Toxocara canis]|uniref:Chromo domain-containing protein n=1 Tax=Toxocara canis TaxID=6265 RepID=A0A183V8P6_TOXCA|nr:unnamed protein product [Toxocara canis]
MWFRLSSAFKFWVLQREPCCVSAREITREGRSLPQCIGDDCDISAYFLLSFDMAEVGEASLALADESGGANGDVEDSDALKTEKNKTVSEQAAVVDENADPIMDENDEKTANNDEEQAEDDTSGLEEGEFEVERILDVKAKDGMLKFEVRWKGYGSEEDSWEPEENLETARLVLDEYIANNKEKVEKVKRILEDKKKRARRNRGKGRSSTPARERRAAAWRRRRRSRSKADKSASECEEINDKKEETRTEAKQKQKYGDHDDEISSNAADNSDDDDFVTSARSSRRGKRAADEQKATASATRASRVKEEPVLKVLFLSLQYIICIFLRLEIRIWK